MEGDGKREFVGEHNNLDFDGTKKKELVELLKFIGKINKDEKINVKDLLLQPNNLFTSFLRTIYKYDNRHNTMVLVKSTIQSSIKLLDTEMEKGQYKNLLMDLDKSRTGIQNLSYTYNSDTMFCCQLERLIEEIDNALKEYINKV